MALHGGFAQHTGSFGARAVWNAAQAYSSEPASPSQFPNGLAYQASQRQRSASRVFSYGIADPRAERRA